MTETFSRTHGARTFDQERLRIECRPTLQETFRDAGYYAYAVGQAARPAAEGAHRLRAAAQLLGKNLVVNRQGDGGLLLGGGSGPAPRRRGRRRKNQHQT